MHITGKEPLVKEIVKVAYPEYKGRKFSLKVSETINIYSQWSGGSKDTFVFVRLIDGAIQGPIPAPSFSPYHDDPRQIIKLDGVLGLICVEHSYFCGKDMGITLHVHPQTLAQDSLTAGGMEPDLSDDEKKCLRATWSCVSSYGGDKNYRQSQSRLSLARWEAVKSDLIEKGYLNKRGALTIKGKNAAESL